MTPIVAIAAVLASASPVVTAEGVSDLSRHAHRGQRLVCLHGTATYVSHSPADLFIQDGTGGVRVRGPVPPGLTYLDEVRIIGRIDRADPANRVTATQIELLGRVEAPPTRCLDLSRVGAMWLDRTLVTARGTIRVARHDRGFVRARLHSPTGEAEVVFPHAPPGPDLDGWPGAPVSVTGVCAVEYEGRRDIAPLPRIYVAGLSAIKFEQPARPPAIARVPAASVPFRARLTADAPRPVEVAGVVTAVWDRRVVFVQDASGGIRVDLAEPRDVAVGTWVAVTGKPGIAGEVGRFDLAGLTAITPGEAEPTPVEGATSSGVLVRVEGRVLEIDRAASHTRVSLFRDGQTFDVYFPWDAADLAQIEPGARVAAVGVRTGGKVVGGSGTGEEILLRSAEDLVFLALPPSWWDGRRWYAVGAFAVVAAVGSLFFARLRRRIRNAVADAAHLEEELHKARKLETAGRLAGGVAHDFNNLLTVINNCADTLKQILPEPHRARLAADILDAGEQAAALSGQLLTLGLGDRERAPDLIDPDATADLNAIVRGASRLLSRMIGTDVNLVLNLASNLPRARIEPRLVARILFNLAVNARDAMPAGGTLTLTTAAAPGNRLTLSVEDTGEGMPPEVQARVFEPYFSTKRPGRGTGLGLATVHEIVESHGGRIEIDSKVGSGTRFTIELPAAGPLSTSVPPDVRTPYPPQSWADPNASNPAVALLVDDDDAVRNVARHYLEMQGLTVIDAAGADEAIRAAEDHGGPIELLMTDLTMPGVGGEELAARLRASRPGMRVVYMSGSGPEEQSNEVGAAFYLRKPFTMRDLVAVVERVRAGRDAPGVVP